MASPLPPLEPNITPEEAIEQFRAWRGSSPVADWTVCGAQVDAWGPPAQARVELELEAPSRVTGLGVTYEAVLQLSIDPDFGTPTGDENTHRVAELAGNLERLATVAEAHPGTKSWLVDHRGARARYEAIGDELGRLVFRFGEGVPETLIFPEAAG